MKKNEYHYLRIARKGLTNQFNVILADRATGKQRLVKLEYAKSLAEKGLLYNKKYGNDFNVDCNKLTEAQTFVDCYTDGWKIKYNGGFFYVISKGRKQLTIGMDALRSFYPEYI